MKRLQNLDSFISYLEETKDKEWCVAIVRNKGNTENCILGHLVNWYYGKDYKENIMDVWDFFEDVWATSYMLYPVNDGENSKYKQETPKKRCIAYLKDLNCGKEKTTQELWERDTQFLKDKKYA